MNPKFLALLGVTGISMPSEVMAMDTVHEQDVPKMQHSEIILETLDVLPNLADGSCGNGGCSANGGCGNNGSC
jgi:hypothetical protein